jgi:hypothetical protein
MDARQPDRVISWSERFGTVPEKPLQFAHHRPLGTSPNVVDKYFYASALGLANPMYVS